MKTKLLSLFITLSLITNAQIYVKKTATGSNNGTSWVNAYTDLRTAITAAAANSTIWVAADTFFLPTGSRSNSFLINSKSLNIYGGFPNTGTPNASNRNPRTNFTVLSGDIGKNDAPFTENTRRTDGDRSDNAYSVIGITLSGANSYTINIDGFVIQDGNAGNTNNGDDGWGAGIDYSRNANGSGTHNINVTNCIFKQNTAYKGAAFNYYMYYTNVGYVNLNLTSNVFTQNISDEFPVFGSIFSGPNSQAVLKVNFTSNAVYRNTSLTPNTALFSAVCHNNNVSGSLFEYQIGFNTFVKNSITSGAIICAEGTKPLSPSNASSLIVTNNIFALNSLSTGIFKRTGSKDFSSYTIVDNNIFEGTDSFQILYGTNRNKITNISFVDTSANNFALTGCSPAANAGDLSVDSKAGGTFYSLTPASKDVLGNTRVLSSSIDIGAYEYTGNAFPSFYTYSKSICSKDSVLFNGAYRKSAGTYKDTLTNYLACDSIITMNLSITSSAGTFNRSICMNDSFLFNNIYRKTQGIYFDTISNFLGCDSFVSCTLTVFTYTPPIIGVQAPNLGTLVVTGGPYNAYAWFKNDTQVAAGATQTTYNFNLVPGEYKLIVLKAFGMQVCTTASNLYSYGLQYTINASAGPNGTISPSGAITALSNESKTFNISANTGFSLDSLIVDGIPIAPVSSYSFNNISANHTIRASFKSISTPSSLIDPITEIPVIYPNPMKDFFEIKANRDLGEIPSQLMDANGRIILENIAANKPIDISNLSKGIYILNMSSGNKNLHFKLIKE